MANKHLKKSTKVFNQFGKKFFVGFRGDLTIVGQCLDECLGKDDKKAYLFKSISCVCIYQVEPYSTADI